jgi:hypothetical protein
MLLGGGLLIVAIGVTVVVAAIVLLDSVNVASLQASSPNGEVGRAFGLLHTCAAVWLLAGSFATPVIAGVAGTGGAIAVSFSAVGILALASAVLFARQAKDVNRVRLPG